MTHVESSHFSELFSVPFKTEAGLSHLLALPLLFHDLSPCYIFFFQASLLPDLIKIDFPLCFLQFSDPNITILAQQRK